MWPDFSSFTYIRRSTRFTVGIQVRRKSVRLSNTTNRLPFAFLSPLLKPFSFKSALPRLSSDTLGNSNSTSLQSHSQLGSHNSSGLCISFSELTSVSGPRQNLLKTHGPLAILSGISHPAISNPCKNVVPVVDSIYQARGSLHNSIDLRVRGSVEVPS
jgi:hypothetical protein